MNEEELRQEAEEYANKKVPKAEMPIRWNSIYTAYLAGAEPREKLNAKLKSEKGCKSCVKFAEVQLAKAKEIIRNLLFHLGNTFIVSYTSKEESIAKAEQFLQEMEK